MAFVDFSDPEDMFGLLIEYVTDELSDAEDSGRRKFLSALLESLAELQDEFAAIPLARKVESLRRLHRSVDAEFENDPVVQHLEDCAAELERVSENSR
jgi:hypothetical protein